MQLNVMFVLKSGKKVVRRIRKIKECRKRSAVNISADSPFPKVKAGVSEFPCGVNACFLVREKSRTCTGLPCNEYKTWLEEVLELSGWCTTKESGIYRLFPSPFTILYPSALAGEGGDVHPCFIINRGSAVCINEYIVYFIYAAF